MPGAERRPETTGRTFSLKMLYSVYVGVGYSLMSARFLLPRMAMGHAPTQARFQPPDVAQHSRSLSRQSAAHRRELLDGGLEREGARLHRLVDSLELGEGCAGRLRLDDPRCESYTVCLCAAPVGPSPMRPPIPRRSPDAHLAAGLPPL